MSSSPLNEWDLKTWSRSVPPSVATHRAFSTRTGRLTRCDAALEPSIGRALNAQLSFWHFLLLPPEIRDSIYDYALLDCHQKTNRSRIHTHSLPLERQYHEKGWIWYCNAFMPTLGPLPALQTPSILRVCKQVSYEALRVLQRTKILVMTVTSVEDDLRELEKVWLPSTSHFPHIRVDFIMTSIAAETLLECFDRVAGLLLRRALSLRSLEIRIAYTHANASTALREHGFALVISQDDIARSMGKLVPLLHAENEQRRREYRPMQFNWGVSDAQMEAGDFSCACTYLRASVLQQIWAGVCGESTEGIDDGALILLEDDCRRYGCKRHSR
ncbi:hypothetical protein E8E12_001598 [Didymella heteroderae]|uniref:Uncharacterized protein n=1 Tax=Didymella heteroderae TaxID=1769908 RepID=A0A9P4WGE8_9PLEO|nr:hypothetical protein E8E12_001598 [Didymella heteroderae]